MTDFLMPALGADMADGVMVEWLVKPGDRIRSGDIVAVVETQKGAIDVEAFLTGVVAEIVVPVGARVPVGTVLARIDDGAADAPRPAPKAAPAPAQKQAQPPPAPLPARSAPATRLRISPAARRLAASLGVDVAGLRGSGIAGALTLADVTAAAAAPPPRPAARRAGFDAAEMRRAIAAAMTRAKREIPHFYLGETIDLAAAMTWLEGFNAAQPPAGRLLPAALLLKAAALALRQVPGLNGTYADGRFTPGSAIHVGWAIALRGGGLVAPAIRDADTLALPALMAAMRDLVARARSSGLRLSELTAPTITVTSLGERGAESVTGVIYPPQVAILGFGRISLRPMVVDGRVAACPAVSVSLAADHRVSDGHVGGLYLAAIRSLLQEPEKL